MRRGTGHTDTVALSLRRIIMGVLAIPLSAAAACHAASVISATDTPPDGGQPVGATDASVSDGTVDAVSLFDAGPPDPCAPEEYDGAALDDSGTTCSLFVRRPCGLPPDSSIRNCTPDLVTCENTCQTELLFRCLLATTTCDLDSGLIPDADIVFECVRCPGAAGRRPRGLEPRARARSGSTSALGDYFASLAHLEEASVPAFLELRRSLASVGAPRALQARACRAARDERRHTGIARRLAHRFGGAPRTPRVRASALPSLEALLVENAVEGCVGEAYGALLAMWQAERAADPEIARAMRTVAREESQHAALAWDILRWGAPRLSPVARRRVARRLAAAAQSVGTGALPAHPSVIRSAGHPPPEVERELLARFRAFAHDEASRALACRTPDPSFGRRARLT